MKKIIKKLAIIISCLVICIIPYKMDYFSIAENVCYVIEQTENTSTNPYYWNIVWYVPLPNNISG